MIPAAAFPKGKKQNNKSPEYTTLANIIKTCITMVAVQNAISYKNYGISVSLEIKYLYKSKVIYITVIVIKIL